MKKALIVANLAGFASFLLNDMKLLIEKGYQVTYAANANKLNWSDTEAKLRELGVTFVQIDFDSKSPFAKMNLTAYRQIKNLLKKGNYDLVHCHTPITGLITRLAANRYRKKGTKVIYTTHGFAFTKKSGKKAWLVFYTLEKICSLFCDAIITINKEDYANAKKMFCKNVFYINGVGVDTKKYREVDVDREEYRKALGIDKDDIMILAVGELSARKNHQIIIQALATLPDKECYVFVICGNGINGGTGQLLQNMADESGVRLKLMGFRRDIPEITKASDFGVIPSVREGLGLAGIQSLAAGIPLLGSDVQGIKDYIVDGVTGYLCDPFDKNAYAEGIVRLSDPVVRLGMKKSCINMAKNFDFEISHKQIRDIYDSILGVL